jgi:endogenous inhibitor of DNA gyrase (YacG/DUF329 family)
MSDSTKPETLRIARCPQCGASSRLDERNAFRPFCSERCKLLDLGAWFDGRHAIPGRSRRRESVAFVVQVALQGDGAALRSAQRRADAQPTGGAFTATRR